MRRKAARPAAGPTAPTGPAGRRRRRGSSNWLRRASLSCEALDRDNYGRIIARCAAGGRDVAATLVSEGLAWAYVRYSSDYVALEAEARAAHRGVWQGPAQVAWDWRRSDGFRPAAARAAEPPAETAAPPAGCAIKGNVSAKGERIYHTPTSPWYARVRIDATHGKRWFCSVEEAEAAGWRAVR